MPAGPGQSGRPLRIPGETSVKTITEIEINLTPIDELRLAPWNLGKIRDERFDNPLPLDRS
jgi:hypothetical protein